MLLFCWSFLTESHKHLKLEKPARQASAFITTYNLISEATVVMNACCVDAVLRYTIAVFTTKLLSADDKIDAFITIFGKRGDTGRRRLRDSLTYPSPFAAGQVDVFFIETVHLGQLQHVLLVLSSGGTGQICYISLFSFEC